VTGGQRTEVTHFRVCIGKLKIGLKPVLFNYSDTFCISNNTSVCSDFWRKRKEAEESSNTILKRIGLMIEVEYTYLTKKKILDESIVR